MNYKFNCKHFSQLTVHELYAIMRLRQEVFVVEQNCAYLDADGKDLDAYHLLCYDEKNELIAYTRLLPKGLAYPHYVSIGRVVSALSVRRQKIGKLLLEKSIGLTKQLFPNEQIKIGAQLYLLGFYKSMGFEPVGDEYLEDGIRHISMILEENKQKKGG